MATSSKAAMAYAVCGRISRCSATGVFSRRSPDSVDAWPPAHMNSLGSMICEGSGPPNAVGAGGSSSDIRNSNRCGRSVEHGTTPGDKVHVHIMQVQFILVRR